MKKSTNENIVATSAVVSVLILVTGLVFPILSSWLIEPVFDHLAVYCWALWVVPFMSLQFFLPAGIYVAFVSSLPVFVKILIYMVLFPVANLWFFIWVGTIFNFLPVSDSIYEISKALAIYTTVLSFALNGAGLLVRFLKKRKKSILAVS